MSRSHALRLCDKSVKPVAATLTVAKMSYNAGMKPAVTTSSGVFSFSWPPTSPSFPPSSSAQLRVSNRMDFMQFATAKSPLCRGFALRRGGSPSRRDFRPNVGGSLNSPHPPPILSHPNPKYLYNPLCKFVLL